MSFDLLKSSRTRLGGHRGCCPSCGQHLNLLSLDQPVIEYRPWHLRDRQALEAYIATLPNETREWLIALFVDPHLQLLAVETVCVGSVGSVTIDIGGLVHRARSLASAGFFLIHNHPSGDPTPSMEDIRVTARLAHISKECDVPLIRHFVIADGGLRSVGEW